MNLYNLLKTPIKTGNFPAAATAPDDPEKIVLRCCVLVTGRQPCHTQYVSGYLFLSVTRNDFGGRVNVLLSNQLFPEYPLAYLPHNYLKPRFSGIRDIEYKDLIHGKTICFYAREINHQTYLVKGIVI